MKQSRRIPAAFALGCLVFWPLAHAKSAVGEAQVQEQGSSGVPSGVSEAADRALREAAAFIGSAQQFSFTADIVFDHVLPSGQKLQYSARENVALQRPGRLYVEWNGDLGDRRFWYDGSTITLYDPSTPFYASETAPPDLDAMLDMLIGQLNFAPPLTDLFRSDPYGKVRDAVQFGIDLGLTQVSGRTCRSLAFVNKSVDWQVWIAADPQPTLCKLTITYATLPSAPQFSAVFSDWDFSPRFGDRAFVASLPSGLEKIPFDEISSAR